MRTTCLTSPLDFSYGYASKMRAPRGKLPLTLKCQASSSLNGLVRIEKFRTIRLLSQWIPRNGASGTLLALKGATYEVPKELCASTGDGVPDGGPPDAVRAVGEAPLEITVEPSFSSRLANSAPRRIKGPSSLVLNSLVFPMKWE